MNNQIKLTDAFWNRYRELIRTEMIPYQWKVLNDEIAVTIERERDDASIPNEKSHAIKNLEIAAGRKEGRHYGWVFQDSDVYKWLEAAAYSLRSHPDEALKELTDSVIDLIGEAQEEDGYLGTFFTIEAPERKFKRLAESHELYCAGHFIEAAAAYYEAVQSEKALQIACKLADCIGANFGPEEGKIHGADGHEEIEIALMRLYRLTGIERYLQLCRYFITIRGTDPAFFQKQWEADAENSAVIPGMNLSHLNYFQYHKPLLEQEEAEGHAVRLVYICTAMADTAAATQDEKLLAACQRLWRSIVDKRMYITGGIGSTVVGEAFTLDYDLPNDTMYCETCASIGLIFFAYQMLKNEAKGEYASVMERALYNTCLAGMALDGRHFFYVNPLEAVPEQSAKNPVKSHVKAVRPEWLGCACCPPNLARLLTSIEQYAFLVKENTLFVNLFLNCESEFQISGQTVQITEKTKYPWEGQISLLVDSQGTEPITLGIWIPDWSETYELEIDGQKTAAEIVDGYAYLTGCFKDTTVMLRLNMQVNLWYANPQVRSDAGKTALTRGPLVYCMEEADNGSDLHLLHLHPEAEITCEYHPKLFNGVTVLKAEGTREQPIAEALPLYRKNQPMTEEKPAVLTWIPYYCWANRGENEMSVWVRIG